MLKYEVKDRILFKDVINHPIFLRLRALDVIRSAGLLNIEFPNPDLNYQDVNVPEVEQV